MTLQKNNLRNLIFMLTRRIFVSWQVSEMWFFPENNVRVDILDLLHFCKSPDTEMLDYIIRDSLAHSISPRFYGWTSRWGSTTMVLESEVFNLILPGHVFSSTAFNNSHLPCCLLSTHMAWVHSHDSHVGGGILNYNISGSLTPSISPEFYGWIGRGGSSSMKHYME
jgi:hypothetical protein